MHSEAWDFVRRVAQCLPPIHSVVEFGALIVNGTVSEIFADAKEYVRVDIKAGNGVDVVMDASDYRGSPKDLVICCEVFEHTPKVKEICKSAYANLKRGGCFIVTCAGIGRDKHSAYGISPMPEDEYYENVTAEYLTGCLREAGFDFVGVEVDSPIGDLYAFAMRVR